MSAVPRSGSVTAGGVGSGGGGGGTSGSGSTITGGEVVGGQSGHGSTPSDFLKAVLGRPVTVKLNSSIEYRGILACLDGYMNIALEQTEEYEHGQLKHSYGDAFIRGNNVLYISTSLSKPSKPVSS